MKKIRKNYRLKAKLVEQILQLAAATGWSNTDVVEKALKKYFDQNDKHTVKVI